MEQITFGEFENKSKKQAALEKEKETFDAMQPILQSVLLRENIPFDSITFRQVEAEQSQYSSVYFYGEGNLFCRISFRGKQSHFSISSKYENIIPESVITKKTKSDNNYVRIPISNPTEICNYSELLSQILDDTINTLQNDFSCCSRYEECSDAKKCINPNVEFALHCAYRKNLKKGNIFYGKNKTI